MYGGTKLTSERLILRAFHENDIAAVVRLADDPEIARNTLRIPHPYTEAHARAWLTAQREDARTGAGAVFAISRADDGVLMGACGMEIFRDHRRGELGYWLGRDFWGRGYTTEAASAVIDWGFTALELNRISAARFSGNGASGRVLEKLGMRREGELRRHVFRGGEFRDMLMYGILREEWEGRI